MITELFLQLATKKPKLQRTVTAVFIANEENGEVKDIGVDKLMETGKLDALRSGPIIWVDCADSQPCIGTCGSMWWTLKATGKRFHSGLPDKGVNALELCNTAVAKLQDHFYADFAPHPDEKKWNFMNPSTMKPTQVKCAAGSVNQIPPWVEISGDVRLTPFYDVAKVREQIAAHVAAINADLSSLRTFGPASKYSIADCQGHLEFTWGEGFMEGIACRLDTEGHRALVAATDKVSGPRLCPSPLPLASARTSPRVAIHPPEAVFLAYPGSREARSGCAARYGPQRVAALSSAGLDTWALRLLHGGWAPLCSPLHYMQGTPSSLAASPVSRLSHLLPHRLAASPPRPSPLTHRSKRLLRCSVSRSPTRLVARCLSCATCSAAASTCR